MRPRISVQRCLFPLFVVLILLFGVTRLQVFVRFNLQYIDTDQPYMWLGAVDYAKGRFYEPRYYGQSYNTFLEALAAVPLVWLKVPVYISVPAATHFLSAFPFLFTAIYLFYRGRKVAGILVMALLLVMPPQYDLLNSLPRGFVSGLFCCSLFVISFLDLGNMRWVVINTVLAVAGCFINPNAAVVAAAFFVFVTLHNLRWKRLLTIVGAAVISGVCCYALFDLFYRLHPEYIKNPITLGITTAYFMENISNLDHRFAHISPFISGNCWPLLVLLFVSGITLAKTSRKAFFGFVAGVAVVLFSFCMGKTTEGMAWVFVSFSRMYLGIPLLIALMFSFVRFSDVMICFLLIPVAMGIYKMSALEESIRREIDPGRWVGVRVYELSMALRSIEAFRGAAEKNNADLVIVSHDFWLGSIIACGGPSVVDDFPQTIETRLDKRYWVEQAFADSIVPRALLVSTAYDLDSRIPRVGNFDLVNFGYGTFLVENNRLPVKQFCMVVDAYERR